MTLQAIRKHFEDAVRAGAADVDPLLLVLTDNQFYTDNDAESEFVLVRLQFGTMTEQALCRPMERIRAALIVEVYTQKGQGPGRSQRIAAAIMKRLNELPRFVNKSVPGTVSGTVDTITGPSFVALDGRPHYFARLSCAVQAAYS